MALSPAFAALAKRTKAKQASSKAKNMTTHASRRNALNLNEGRQATEFVQVPRSKTKDSAYYEKMADNIDPIFTEDYNEALLADKKGVMEGIINFHRDEAGDHMSRTDAEEYDTEDDYEWVPKPKMHNYTDRQLERITNFGHVDSIHALGNLLEYTQRIAEQLETKATLYEDPLDVTVAKLTADAVNNIRHAMDLYTSSGVDYLSMMKQNTNSEQVSDFFRECLDFLDPFDDEDTADPIGYGTRKYARLGIDHEKEDVRSKVRKREINQRHNGIKPNGCVLVDDE